MYLEGVAQWEMVNHTYLGVGSQGSGEGSAIVKVGSIDAAAGYNTTTIQVSVQTSSNSCA